MNQIAIIVAESNIFVSEYNPRRFEPNSAVTQLIQGIYRDFPDHALQILRKRIFINYPPSIMCRGMISIAAKRYSYDPQQVLKLRTENESIISVRYDINSPLKTKSFSGQIPLLRWLAAPSEKREEPRYKQDRPIRVALRDEISSEFVVATNSSGANKTQHAEVNLLQSYFQQFSKGFHSPMQLFTSLQCCKMCAGMMWHMHANPLQNLKVYFLEKELGPSARDSIFAANSNIRRSLYSDTQSICKQIEFNINSINIPIQ